MSKKTTKSIKKHSIKEVDSLIESINKRFPDMTEEAICLALKRNEGYIAQLRSREKTRVTIYVLGVGGKKETGINPVSIYDL